jgi:hypothetical protein
MSPSREGSRSALTRLGGEFFVIVLGVLVALGVDSLWEERGERAREAEYYRAISEELARDTLQYASAIRFIERSIEASKHVIAGLKGELSSYRAERPLAQSLVLAGWVNYPDWASGTIDELINSGEIRLLRNAGVKRAVLAHYSGTRAYRERILGPMHSSYLEYARATRGLVPPEQHMAFYRKEFGAEVAYVAVEDDDLAMLLEGNHELLLIAEAMFTEWWSLWNMYNYEWDSARTVLEFLDREVL